jgi:protein-tyrosine phosphatase
VTGTLLVVCTANICRSPLAQREFQRAFSSGGRFGTVEVTSAGTRALEGRPMCAVSAAALPDDADDDGFAEAHRSQPLSAEAVRRSDLVLVMERDHRSTVAQLAPGTQARVFTLREAEGLLAVLQERDAPPVGDLAALASALHSVRGFAPLPPEPPKRRWFQRPVEPEDPLTIVDGHGLDDELHAAAVAAVRETAGRVAGALLVRLGP